MCSNEAVRNDGGLARRIAWTTDGWFITLRDYDAGLSSGLGRQHVDIRCVGKEVVAGPFPTRERLVTWFKRFLATHGRPRNPEGRTDYRPFTFSE